MRTKTIIVSILIVILISAIGIGAYIFLSKEEPPLPPRQLNLILSCEDYFTAEPCGTDFSIEDENGTVLDSGHIEYGIWTIFNSSVPEDVNLYLYGGVDTSVDDSHYSSLKFLGARDDTVQTKYRALKKAEEIIITHTGKIEDNNIVINITAKDGIISKTSACLSWSFGILEARFPQFVKKCDSGSWNNYTGFTTVKPNWFKRLFGAKDKQVKDYLPMGMYVCDDDVEFCNKAEGNMCYLPKIKTPSRLSGKTDECYSLGKTIIENETISLALDIDVIDTIYGDDYLVLYILDKEKIKINGKYSYEIEDLQGNDVGMKDITYRIEN